MPVEIELLEDDRVIIVHYIGACSLEEMDDAVLSHVFPYMNAHASEPVHVIYDVLRLELDFPDFIKYITLAGKRREQGLVPSNSVQHFVGSNTWATNFRTWVYRKFNASISAFENVNNALMYIRSAIESAQKIDDVEDTGT